jgi:hypothetical protein
MTMENTTPEFTEEEATEFFARVFRGKHHIPGRLKRLHRRGWAIASGDGHLSTFDSDFLTRLVVHAHDCAIRVEIQPCNMQRVRILAHKRSRDGEPNYPLATSHPTLEAAAEKFREGAR